jgi:hypothetical protein
MTPTMTGRNVWHQCPHSSFYGRPLNPSRCTNSRYSRTAVLLVWCCSRLFARDYGRPVQVAGECDACVAAVQRLHGREHCKCVEGTGRSDDRLALSPPGNLSYGDQDDAERREDAAEQ